MAATDFELKSVYQTNYSYLLSLAENSKMRAPEHYGELANVLEKYREYVKRAAQLDDLPEVPR